MNLVNIQANFKGRPVSATAEIPACWDEVPNSLYRILLEIKESSDEYLNKFDKTYRAFMLFCTVNRRTLRIFHKLLPEEIYDVLHMVNWVFDTLALHTSKGVLLGPDHDLKNMRFGEWVAADSYFTAYCEDKDESSLNKLIAVIARPQGKGDEYQPGTPAYRADRREKFNDSLVAERAAVIAKLPLEKREAIFDWFAGCKYDLKESYSEIFESSDGKKNKTDTILAGYGWFGIYDDLRGDPKFGGPAALEEEFVHTVFASLVRSHYKFKQLKREYAL